MAAGRGRLAPRRDAQAWVVRAGRKGETVEHNLQHGVASYEWDQLPDLRTYADVEELKSDIDVRTPGLKGNPHKIGNHAGQLWRFRSEIQRGDIVVLPLKDRGKNQYVAIGRVTGPYLFDATQGSGAKHRIPVEWLDAKVHISALDTGLRDWIRKKTRGTVRQIRSADAATRLLHTAVQAFSGDEAGVQNLGNQAMPEGAIAHAQVLRYERSASARAACLRHFGYRCQVCDLDFEERYGELGLGFMHVHHIVPLHEVAGIPHYRVDPIRDLRPVCPNCHAMLHRPKDRTLTVEELREVLRPERSNNS